MAKPFAPDELVARIAQALERTRRARAELDQQRESLLMELHDGVSANLARAGLLLAGGEKQNVEANVAAARRAVAEALVETRAAFALLDDGEVELSLLIAEVRRAVSEAAEEHGLRVEVRSEVSGERSVRAARAHVVRRLASEAMTNVLRHAGAKTVRLRFEVRAGALEASLEDDGRGLDASLVKPDGEAGRGLGLARQRAARVGGSVSVRSLPEGGTRFSFVVPLDEPASTG